MHLYHYLFCFCLSFSFGVGNTDQITVGNVTHRVTSRANLLVHFVATADTAMQTN